MNILFSVQNLGLGGVTTYVLHLASGLCKRHKIVIYDHNPYYYDEAFCSWLPNTVVIEKVKVHNTRDRVIWKINALLQKIGFRIQFWELCKNRHYQATLRKHHIEVITSFDKFSDRIVTDHNPSGIPVVLSLHGSYDISGFYQMPEPEIKEYESVFRKVHAIVYKADCNIAILKHYKNLDNIVVVKKIFHGFTLDPPGPEAAGLRSLLGISGSAFVYGMIGRGVPEKGWKEALEAFNKLCSSTDQDIHFIAIGKSAYLSELQQEYSANRRIHFTGFVKNSIDWISNFDVGILPSYAQTENFTFSVVEYMFCGKPAIVTNHGEIPVTLDADGEKAGIITHLMNGRPDVEALELAMEHYLTDQALYTLHARLTQRAVEKFNSEAACHAYEEIFSAIVFENKLKLT